MCIIISYLIYSVKCLLPGEEGIFLKINQVILRFIFIKFLFEYSISQFNCVVFCFRLIFYCIFLQYQASNFPSLHSDL